MYKTKYDVSDFEGLVSRGKPHQEKKRLLKCKADQNLHLRSMVLVVEALSSMQESLMDCYLKEVSLKTLRVN